MEKAQQNVILDENLSYEQIVDSTHQAIRRGQSILYPTDTIWGIGCDITNESAIKYVREVKKVDDSYPMVLLVNNIMMLKQYITYIHPRVETLLLYHNQPLTLIYDANENLSPSLINEDNRIAIRVCQDDFCNELIYHLEKPLLATSASLRREKYPKTFSDISDEIKDGVDFIVPLRHDIEEKMKPSIMASFNPKGDLQFLRK